LYSVRELYHRPYVDDAPDDYRVPGRLSDILTPLSAEPAPGFEDNAAVSGTTVWIELVPGVYSAAAQFAEQPGGTRARR
jgi:hypothetical protein